LHQDLNGKQQDWEAVVLIPFMEESRLLSAMRPLYPRLTSEEADRNKHGPMWVCTYSQVGSSLALFSSLNSGFGFKLDSGVFRAKIDFCTVPVVH
jgi:5'-3' exonuclease